MARRELLSNKAELLTVTNCPSLPRFNLNKDSFFNAWRICFNKPTVTFWQMSQIWHKMRLFRLLSCQHRNLPLDCGSLALSDCMQHPENSFPSVNEPSTLCCAKGVYKTETQKLEVHVFLWIATVLCNAQNTEQKQKLWTVLKGSDQEPPWTCKGESLKQPS